MKQISHELQEKLTRLIDQWHEAGRAGFEAAHSNLIHDNFNVKACKVGRKYVNLDNGTSGVFMLEISTGNIYGIKAYGKVNKKKLIGNIETADGELLHRFGDYWR